MADPKMKTKSVRSKKSIAARANASYATSGKTKTVAARKQANKILSALEEANEIHTGRKKGKSFDQFLKEI